LPRSKKKYGGGVDNRVDNDWFGQQQGHGEQFESQNYGQNYGKTVSKPSYSHEGQETRGYHKVNQKAKEAQAIAGKFHFSAKNLIGGAPEAKHFSSYGSKQSGSHQGAGAQKYGRYPRLEERENQVHELQDYFHSYAAEARMKKQQEQAREEKLKSQKKGDYSQH